MPLCVKVSEFCQTQGGTQGKTQSALTASIPIPFEIQKGSSTFLLKKENTNKRWSLKSLFFFFIFFFKNQQVKRVVAALKQCKRLALRVNCSAKMCSQFLRRRFSLLLRCCSFLILILLPVFSSSLFFDFLFSILYLLGLWLFAVCSLP